MATRTEKKTRTAIGRYQLLDKIAKGGMGVVYRARDPQTDATVAVKVFALDLEADRILIERFTTTPEDAFEMLKRSSQKLNVKLREVARILAETGELEK